MKPAFWQGKRVFLTGHTGFKGSWLALWLQRSGAVLTGYSLPPATNPSLFDVAEVGTGMTSIFGDIRDPAALDAAMQAAQPEIVFHLAAQPLVRYSYVNPVETYSTNVMGLVHLFEAIRKTPSVRAVVNVTSDKCYENHEWVWGYRETDAMGGHDPYSNSKGCAELVTQAYRDSFFGDTSQVALASARAGNVIGGGDWALDRLVPDIIRAIEAGRPVQIRSPESIRPWQHVLEPLSGYLQLAERLFSEGEAFAQGWNFGPGDADAKRVQWIVERLVSEWGDGATYEIHTAGATHHEARYLKLDCSKAAALLDWTPRWDLSTTLTRICEWHKALRTGADMRAVTLSQIDSFEKARPAL
ncbi:CDP-glucose 4,6-dehydratase [Pandoraea anapnoica]|uniref:CDP-glucose 4,6-dehydratase n=1 Tax=Pandoraea anapnoica TaxID=2508301 RepID=A0A5E5AM48_9BURK|nr:CDP-glucose 4,6-dehydratase [Pandoraea anapnoica]VVE74097.1 CDP-glucose 4,6-dehydratase [Pandoraea anapnoica]